MGTELVIKLIVTKTGVGRDPYDWETTLVEIDHGVLILRNTEGVLLHAYSPGAWLEVDVEK